MGVAFFLWIADAFKGGRILVKNVKGWNMMECSQKDGNINGLYFRTDLIICKHLSSCIKRLNIV